MVAKREATSPTRNALMKGDNRILYSEKFPGGASAPLFTFALNSKSINRWESRKKVPS